MWPSQLKLNSAVPKAASRPNYSTFVFAYVTSGPIRPFEANRSRIQVAICYALLCPVPQIIAGTLIRSVFVCSPITRTIRKKLRIETRTASSFVNGNGSCSDCDNCRYCYCKGETQENESTRSNSGSGSSKLFSQDIKKKEKTSASPKSSNHGLLTNQQLIYANRAPVENNRKSLTNTSPPAVFHVNVFD